MICRPSSGSGTWPYCRRAPRACRIRFLKRWPRVCRCWRRSRWDSGGRRRRNRLACPATLSGRDGRRDSEAGRFASGSPGPGPGSTAMRRRALLLRCHGGAISGRPVPTVKVRCRGDICQKGRVDQGGRSTGGKQIRRDRSHLTLITRRSPHVPASRRSTLWFGA